MNLKTDVRERILLGSDESIYPPSVQEELDLVAAVRDSADALARHLERLAAALQAGSPEAARTMLGTLYGDGDAVPGVHNGVWAAFRQVRTQVETAATPQQLSLGLPLDEATIHADYREGSFDSASEAVFECYRGFARVLSLAGIKTGPFKEVAVLHLAQPQNSGPVSTEFPQLTKETMDALQAVSESFWSNDFRALRQAVTAECNRAAKEIIDSWRGESVVQSKSQESRESAGPSTQNVQPAEYLEGWDQILPALARSDNPSERSKIKDLNERYGGPIISRGRGTKPVVEKGRLIHWWNGLEQRWIKMSQQADRERRDRQQSVAAQHKFGKSGKVVPEIGGHVRRRRGSSDEL